MTMKGDRVFNTPWFSVDSLNVAGIDGAYFRINIPTGVVVLPVTPEGNFVLIRQTRPLLGRVTLEFPAGAVESGETPEQSAIRELTEEAGLVTSRLIKVGEGVIRVDREDAVNYFFVALDVRPASQIEQEIEFETKTVSPAEFKAIVQRGEFDHIAALPIITFAAWKAGLDLV